MNSIVTTYDEITGSEKTFIRLALMFSYPTDADPRNSDYQIRHLAQERRSKSDWRNDIKEESRTRIKTFLSGFIQKLEEP
jgi:hypothetical protein